jgi:hypothetical protein
MVFPGGSRLLEVVDAKGVVEETGFSGGGDEA